MVKTQVQLPDELYRAAKELAARKEWSLAEVVRRAMENMLCLFPSASARDAVWELPQPRALGGDAFFTNPDWRYDLHQPHGAVREANATYRTGRRAKRK